MKKRVVGLLVGCFWVAQVHAATVYVDVDSSNPVSPYSSWATAATNLQDAVDISLDGDTVLVEDGIYASGGAVTPGYTTTNRVCVTNAISVQSVNGPDVTVIEGFKDTSYPYLKSVRGVRLSHGASLSGFSITLGTADFYSGNREFEKSGGGVWMTTGCLVSNCVLYANSSREYGGGAMLYQGGKMTHCLVKENDAVSYGGGIILYAGGEVENSLFINNTVQYYGGGVTFWSGGTMNNCTVSRNSASYGGGGCYVMNGTINNSIVSENSGSSTRFNLYGENTSSCHNSCVPDGSRIFSHGIEGCITNNPLLAGVALGDCRLLANSPCINAGSNAYATAATDLEGSPRIQDSIVDMGAYETPVSPSFIITSSFSGVGSIEPESPHVFQGNDQHFSIQPALGYYLDALTVDGSSVPLVSNYTFNNVQSTHTISAIFSTDPHDLMVDHGTGDGSYVIYTEVPVVAAAGAAGYGFSGWTVEPSGYTDHISDVYSASTVFTMPETNATLTAHYALLTAYVDASRPDDSGDGMSWATAKKTIQAAVNLAAVDGTVWVTNGIYTPSSEIILIKPMTVRSVNGVDETMVDGGGTHRCFNLGSSGGLISGFTITNGYASSSGGGGVICDKNSSSRVENCVLTGNHVKYSGGGMYYGVLSNCLVRGNSAGYSGGGLNDCQADNCTIIKNIAINSGGGGVYQGVANNCIITQNSAKQRGGGAAYGVVNNCVINDNTIESEEGGGLFDCLARNCTITGNSGVKGGGSCASDLLNCIVWHNMPDNLFIGNGWVSNSCSPDVTAGVNGNSTNAPLLVSSSHIATNSPCRGAGNYSDVVGVDIDGTSWENPPSMGCDEKIVGETPSGEIQLNISGPQLIVKGYVGEYSIGVFGYVSEFHVDFGNGIVRTNEFVSEMQWAVTGTYSVVVSAYNDDYPGGVFATQSVVVVDEAQSIIYVSTTGNDGNDGSSWASAKATIQAGVDAQNYEGGLVRVSEGVFSLSDSIAVRKPIRLISQSGADLTSIVGDGANLCFDLGTSECVVSGFTITNGYARYGGGILCLDTTPLVENCILTGNESQYGGGGIQYGTIKNSIIRENIKGGTRFSHAINCEISGNTGNGVYGGISEDCTISSNSASGVLRGAALRCLIAENTARDGGGSCQASLDSCVVSNNVAVDAGGGISGGSATNCTIIGNSSLGYGAGGVEYATVYDCLIIGNSTAGDGGGVRNGKAYYCTITENVAVRRGGGLCDSVATHCTITENMTQESGGGISGVAAYGNSFVTNCIISGNRAELSGGGLAGGVAVNCAINGNTAKSHGGGSANTSLNNCTVVGNIGFSGGGNYGGTIRNCILWNNQPEDYYGSSLGASYTCAKNLTAGERGNITDDPLLVSVTHISTNSPCWGTGNIGYTSDTDFDGDLWRNPPSMGCDEAIPGAPIDGDISLSLNGLHTLSSGFSETYLIVVVGNVTRFQVDFGNGHISKNKLIVANQWEIPGTYDVVITAWNDDYPFGLSVTETVQVLNAETTAIYVSTTGSDANGGTSWADAKVTLQAGVDAQMLESGLVLLSDGTFSLSAPVSINKRILLKSLNGAASTTINGGGSHRGFNLGSSRCTLSGLTITNCVSSAIVCDNNTPIIEKCLITGNSGTDGAGMYKGTANDCTIAGNIASGDGGGMYNGNANHCIISDNVADSGGGLFTWHGTANYCLIKNNTSGYGGGAWNGILNNCTIVNNQAIGLGARGGGCYGATINNSIIWYNTAQQTGDNVSQPLGVNHSCIPGYIGDSSPRFVGGNDYHLQATSICVDGGSNAYLFFTTDLDGIPLPLDGDTNGTAVVDIGCYEFIHILADSDGDGLTDGDELENHGTDPTNDNTDGDALGDGDEAIAGTDPLDPSDFFHMASIEDAFPAIIHFQSLADRQYQMFGCSNLVDAIWFPVSGAELRMGVGGADSMSDTNSTPTARFYRLEVSKP